MWWLSGGSHIHFHPENSSFCPTVKVTSLFLSTWFLSLNLTNGTFTLCIWMRHRRCFAHHTQMLKERLCTANRGWRVPFACSKGCMTKWWYLTTWNENMFENLELSNALCPTSHQHFLCYIHWWSVCIKMASVRHWHIGNIGEIQPWRHVWAARLCVSIVHQNQCLANIPEW